MLKCYVAVLACVFSISAIAQVTTNLVVNGSFESSSTNLTGWTFAQGASAASGTCSFNAAVAPGTEMVTGHAGFPATNGSNIALGSSHSTTNAAYSCTLYQDIAIPAGATTATLSFDAGLIYDGIPQFSAALFWGLYPTSRVPDYFSSTLVGSSGFYEPASSNTTLVHQSTSFNVSSLAGTTVRLAIILGSVSSSGTALIAGVDNVQLQVTAPAPAPVSTPTLSGWGMIGLGGLLMLYGVRRLRSSDDISGP